MSEAYATGGEGRPLAGYLALMAGFSAMTSAGALRLRRRPLPQFTNGDLVLLAVATHKASRLLTKDSITSALKAPFVRYVEPAGGGEVNEEVRASGAAHAVGDFLICPICMDLWVASALAIGLGLAPRATRLVAFVPARSETLP
jgi:hypothetical protein